MIFRLRRYRYVDRYRIPYNGENSDLEEEEEVSEGGQNYGKTIPTLKMKMPVHYDDQGEDIEMADVFSSTEDEEEFKGFANSSFTWTSTKTAHRTESNTRGFCKRILFFHKFFDDDVLIHLVTETKDFQD